MKKIEDMCKISSNLNFHIHYFTAVHFPHQLILKDSLVIFSSNKSYLSKNVFAALAILMFATDFETFF